MCGAEDEVVAVHGADDLKPDGSSIGGEAARNTGGRLERQVERIRERCPSRKVVFVDLRWRTSVGRKRGHRGCGQQEQVAAR